MPHRRNRVFVATDSPPAAAEDFPDVLTSLHASPTEGVDSFEASAESCTPCDDDDTTSSVATMASVSQNGSSDTLQEFRGTQWL
jgi:hypothetical protein